GEPPPKVYQQHVVREAPGVVGPVGLAIALWMRLFAEGALLTSVCNLPEANSEERRFRVLCAALPTDIAGSPPDLASGTTFPIDRCRRCGHPVSSRGPGGATRRGPWRKFDASASVFAGAWHTEPSAIAPSRRAPQGGD